MAQRRAIYRCNHGNFDVQKVGKQLLAFPVGLVPLLGRSLGRTRRCPLGPEKASPVPVTMMTRFPRSLPTSAKARGNSSWGPDPHCNGPPPVWKVICRMPFRRSNLMLLYWSAYCSSATTLPSRLWVLARVYTSLAEGQRMGRPAPEQSHLVHRVQSFLHKLEVAVCMGQSCMDSTGPRSGGVDYTPLKKASHCVPLGPSGRSVQDRHGGNGLILKLHTDLR